MAKAMTSAMSWAVIDISSYIWSIACLVSAWVMWCVSSVATAPGDVGEVHEVAAAVAELVEEDLGCGHGAEQVDLDHLADLLPGSRFEEGLNLLGSWAATLDETQTAPATSEPRRV